MILTLLPALGAVWGTRWFVTQDGPAHVYNAEILARSFDDVSPFRDFYEIHWQPLPNWTGHLLLAAMVRIMPIRLADLMITSLTMVGFAGTIFWLRRRVRGEEAQTGALLLSALLALNIAWLFGFTNFLLGASLFPIILGVWWSRRNDPGLAWVAVLMALVVLAYFSHLVSLGLTTLGVIVLTLLTPADRPIDPNSGKAQAERQLLGRFKATALALSPLLILGPIYLRLSRQHGGPSPFPVWDKLTRPWLISSWLSQLGWVDPLTLMSKTALPFTERSGRAFAILSPALWAFAAVALWGSGEAIRGYRNPRGSGPESRRKDLRGWWVLATLLILGGYFGPDSFGPDHGEYLPQRLILLGLVALVPVFDLDPSSRTGRASIGALVIALALQSLIVWDYAIHSGRTAGNFAAVREMVGHGQRIGTLLTRTKSRFRANPLLHADNWLGIETGNIVWSNYETRYYYFPVHFKDGLNRPDPRKLEDISINEGPGNRKAREQDWTGLLIEHASSMDLLACWGEDAGLDQITERWFDPDPVLRAGDLRILKRRQDP